MLVRIVSLLILSLVSGLIHAGTYTCPMLKPKTVYQPNTNYKNVAGVEWTFASANPGSIDSNTPIETTAASNTCTGKAECTIACQYKPNKMYFYKKFDQKPYPTCKINTSGDGFDCT